MEDSENGVFTVRAEEDDEDDDQDPPERRDRQNECHVRQVRQNERSQRQNVSDEDKLDFNDRPLTQPNPARQLSQTFSDDSDEEEIPKKRSNLGFSHFFSSCREFSFTNCNFSF